MYHRTFFFVYCWDKSLLFVSFNVFVCGSSTVQSLRMCIYILLENKTSLCVFYSSNLILSNCICWLCIFQQMLELSKNVRELKSILYGNSESEPVAEACAQLTQEFFRDNTLRLLIKCLPKLNLEVSGTETSDFLGFPWRNYQLNSFSCFTFVVFCWYSFEIPHSCTWRWAGWEPKRK